MSEADRSLAIFIDFENLALGLQNQRERFDISRVLERLVEKGKVVVKKAYADWNRFSNYTALLHEAAIELIEIPRRLQTGKNSADIRLCVDAMDLAYSKEHINTFVVLSGDSDFSPLVSKLKELGKHVIGLGMQQSTSELLRDNCDEFIYYEDLGKTSAESPAIDSHLPETKRKAFALLLESLLALRRENKDVLWSSMIKDTMKRKKPSFNETYHGYRTFSELLEDAAAHGILELDTDKRSRTYVVRRFGSEMHHEAPPPDVATGDGQGPQTIPMPTVATEVGTEIPGGTMKKSRRRRRGRGRGEGNGNGNGNGHGQQIARPGGMVVVPMNVPVEIPRPEPVVTAPTVEAPEEEISVAPAPIPEPPVIVLAPKPERQPQPERLPQPIPEPATDFDRDPFSAGLWDDIEVPVVPGPNRAVPSSPEQAATPVSTPEAQEEEPEPAKKSRSRTGRKTTSGKTKRATPPPKSRKGTTKTKPTSETNGE